MLDGSAVRTARWEVLNLCSSGCNQTQRGLVMVKGRSIYNHALARLQARHEKIFDNQVKNLASNLSFYLHGRLDTMLTHGANHGELCLDLKRFRHFRAFTFLGLRVRACHACIDAKRANGHQ